MSTGRREDLPKKQKQLRATTADRLEGIVEAAERAAEGVIDDAEAQARRYLAQARAEADRVSDRRLSDLSGLVDALLGQALSLRREAERLQATLEEAKLRIDPEQPVGVVEEVPTSEEPALWIEAPRLRAVAATEEPTAATEAQPSDAAGARLLATQLAVSGSSREEIEQRLRSRFEIEDTTPILDAILGPEE
jgi:cell division septum initiation protein DivIVA